MEEQKNKSSSERTITRRYFFEMLGSGAIGTVTFGSTILTYQFLSPNVLLEPPMTFKAGKPEDYPMDSVTLIPNQKVFIVREKAGYFYALSAVCTHLGCIANWKPEGIEGHPEGIIACPCHGSKFSRTGEVLTGPAPQALPRVQITLTDSGDLLVDKGTVVGEEQILKV